METDGTVLSVAQMYWTKSYSILPGRPEHTEQTQSTCQGKVWFGKLTVLDMT